jgi:imidazolonepropionase
MLIRNLAGLFDGAGFVKKRGRHPAPADCGFRPGPIDITIDDRTGAIASSPAAGGQSIDATGLIALPGYIDPHTHTIFGGQRFSEYFMRWAGKSYLEISQGGGGIHSTVHATASTADQDLRELLYVRLRDMLAAGATTAEVKSGYASSAEGELRLLLIIKSVTAEASLPEIRTSFLALHALPPGRDEDVYVEEMIRALPRVKDEQLATQVDTFPEKGFFTRDSALRFSRAARDLGFGVKVHADELSDLGTSSTFSDLGAWSIDHLQFISDEAVGKLKTSPTVATMLPATSFFVGLPYANARRLLDAGARVAVATDFNPGTAPAHDLQLTHLLAASQMKMTAAEILCATTFNAAAALGLEQTHGALMPGRVGDVLLFKPETRRTSEDGAELLHEIFLHRLRPHTVIRRGRACRLSAGT